MGGFFISVNELNRVLGTAAMPAVFDVRRRAAYEAEATMLPTARWRDPAAIDAWAGGLDPAETVVLYCVHGHQVSQSAAALLRARGFLASALAGGLEAWRDSAAPLVGKAGWAERDGPGPGRWVTGAGHGIDRTACAWLIRRFVDRDAEILFVETEQVSAVAGEVGGMPFGIGGVDSGSCGDRCELDAFIDRFGVEDPALRRLAAIVRGADSDNRDVAPEAAGVLAVLLGVSSIATDDRDALRRGLGLFDALYAACRMADGIAPIPPSASEAA